MTQTADAYLAPPPPGILAIIARAPLVIVASTFTIYFVLATFTLYWLTAAGAALGALIIPRALIARAPLAWMTAAAILVAAATQTVPDFFPDYSQPAQLAAEAGLWLSMGLFARAYFIYAQLPPTFDGLKAMIAQNPVDRWFSSVLNKPLDAVFTRSWIATSVAVIPISVMLYNPATVNYFVVAAFSALVLLVQFPHELMDHTNHHNRIFTPKADAAPWVKALLRGLNFYSNWILCILMTRVPEYHRIQHVYMHHVEENGPRDVQSTLAYDRLSFLDFCVHAFWQGLDLTTGHATIRYLWSKNKNRQARALIIGFAVWWAFVIGVALFNPVAAGLVLLCRFIGGNILSLFAFFQHGLVDPEDVLDVHGNTVTYAGDEHGNLGNDFHLEHHLRPGRHWSEYYDDFVKLGGKEGAYRAVVVENTDAFGPLAFVASLWRRDFRAIAAHAHLPRPHAGDPSDVERFVVARTRPMPAETKPALVVLIDRQLGRLMALALPTRFRV